MDHRVEEGVGCKLGLHVSRRGGEADWWGFDLGATFSFPRPYNMHHRVAMFWK
eukprot:CAMPEP_0177668320 /NCGR_PEP_ID=MMETSP0447-20121125/22691_1 /TAXON_ID=0 /ORGANISM="Stygamoeba regulata, Strain BSH-02190019" /LENGTH=52 /DNA_ID=CAMNT_0019174805 /DNA_START=216 /DNA_END=371 /DNA_ORIENTATION=-